MKKIARFFSYIWVRTKHNWGLKVLAFFFAILLWNSVISRTNPDVSHTIDDVPLTVIGVEQLSENNLALLDSISSYSRTVKVTLDIARNERADFDDNLVFVTLDLSKIPTTGTYDIKLIANTTQGEVRRLTPETISVSVDEKENRVIPVECEVIGTLMDNYHRGALVLSPNAIQVSGAKSIVQNIERAYMSLDLSERIESVSIPKEYTFIDKGGSAIDASSLTVSTDAVVLEMNITPKKILRVTPTFLGQDKIMDGYEIVDIVVEPETIEVTGPVELLDGMISLPLEGVDLTDSFENIFIQDLIIMLPDTIELLGVDTASVLIEIKETMSEVVFEQVDIALRNVPEGLKPFEFDAKVDITVRAPAIIIDNIAPSHISLYVDMTGALVGDTTLPILYETPEEYRVDFVYIPQDNITITLQ